MFRSLANYLVPTIVVLLQFCILTDSSDGDTRWIDDSFGAIEKGDVASLFLNFGRKRNTSQRDFYENLENVEITFKNKTDILSRLLKLNIDRLRNDTDEIELVFLIDASGSVGLENFRSELDFVKKLLSDFTVQPTATRVAVVTFGGRRNIRRNIDEISRTRETDYKCYLLNKQLNNISYTGGGTYTRGALKEALAILEKGRKGAKKAVFLITDGFSNGGDPRPAANLLKSAGATVFTFGIRTGNVEELHDIASSPGYTHSYLLDSFAEFEALARRALHRDLKSGQYVDVVPPDNCNLLCANESIDDEQNCCDDLATCSCGIATGHYACICPAGYFGSGFKGSCKPCPNGTYASGEVSGDSTSLCISCPDANHVTIKLPATSIEHCVCASGFVTDKNKCEVITCPKLKVPENGYLVKANACTNVVHAACGIRCRIGFYLTGDSIRLCGKNGTWSGNEPKCLLKTCPALRAPAHGRMRCQHEEYYQHRIKDDAMNYPIDTRCQFRCESGYQLRGSKIRNCLPLSQWDGLKASCKATKCEPLKQIANGQIEPANCSGPEKISFATNCTISCKKGFALEGPRFRSCGGRTGVWTQRHSVNRCIDKTPPSIICPSDISINSLPKENYAYVSWSKPKVTDNADESPVVWTKPYVSFPWKVRIGTRTVVYVTQDSAGNKARCKLKIKVLDKEPPMIENCIDPPVFFTDSEMGVSNVTWDEPGFYDNSKAPVRVDQSHRPGENTFLIGSTKVFYNATDKYDNIAICVLNITVTNICKETLKPYKGYSECSPVTSGETECTIACEEGYGFAIESTNFKAVKDEFALKCNASNINWDDDNYVPDCSETYVPKTVSQEGSIMLEGNTTIVCDNRTTLRELSEYITEELRLNLLDICGNDIECNLISFDPECEESLLSTENVHSNLIRRRRDGTNYSDSSAIDFMNNELTANIVHRLKRAVKENHSRNKEKIRTRKKKEKIEIKFRFIGRIIEENFENPRQGIQKLKQKMASLTQSGKLNLLNTRTNQEIAKLALNLHLVFKDFQEHCDPGSVLKKYTCVKCPTGTFYDSSSKRCYPCSFGEYENISGSLKCKRCPERTFTKKMHAKSLKDCIPMCKPGYYSKRKRYHRSSMALEPCLMCDVGFYQPDYGQTRCLSCPFNKTTEFRASININDCVVLNETGSDVCQVEPCLNGGQCIEEEDSFSCECRDHYIGSKCETFQNPCDSSPCLNEGVCEVRSESNGTTFYSCTCKSGYVGSSCELYIDECANNPCQNNGRCISTESDYTCECKDGFEGQFCEIPMDHCDPLPCEEGSTCRTVNETWQCFCKPGFLGRHCNLLPCDWLPCHSNALCINIEEENATRMSYRCECPDGYTGENCTTKIDYCENSPCLNNGDCNGGIYNYTCTCPVPFTGKNCETGKYCQLSSDYVMHFVKSGTTDYISMKGPRENLSELTACLWLQSKDTFNYGTVLSYATRYHDNAFTLTDYNGFVIYINGQKVVTDIKVNDGHWHFFCITWDSKNGHWKIFIDGFIKDTGFGLSKRIEIPGNGSLVIGQEQDRLGGGFSESESFLGKLTLLDIWNTVLKEADIKHLFNVCEKYHGSVIAWSQLQEHVYGDVAILKSPFCRGCPSPVIPFRGSINASDDLSEVTYYCDAGYIVRFHGKENRFLKIKCMKQGQWEGYHSPICVKRRCGSPGYFPRGRIHGRSYFFGDEIHYSCMNGYELRGNPHRICNSEGKWSGLPPICIGKTCKNLLAPENGDIEYVIEENERDDISILQAGQQLEFKCDPGFRLEGENFLTCLESGIWDHDRPTCVPYGCSPPQKIDHGDIIFTNFSNDNVTFTADYVSNTARNNSEREYHFGDVVGFSCHQGYKFRNNQNLAEFRIECSENGSWSGYIPNCVSLKCPWPNAVKGGRLFLQTHDDDIEIFSRTNTSFNVRNISLENVNNNVAKNETVENMFVPGAEILVKCDLGYELIGESIRKCTEKEEWSSTNSYCKPRECDMKDHPLYQFFNAELISENYTEHSLENGSIKQSSEKSHSGSYRNLRYTIEGNSYMEKIIVTCKDNSKMDLNELNVNVVLSNLTWTCNVNGEWEIGDAKLNDTKFEDLLNDITDICQKVTCPSPTVPEHGYIINDNTNDSFSLINSTVVFKCRNGFILEGNEKIVCLSNGSWTALPSCKPVTCGTPTVIPNASLKEKIDGNFTFGNMITYQCVPGYLMFGQSNARCLANGKWSRVYSKCSKLSCNKPKLLPGATVYGRSYLYQDQLTYVCPNGKKRGLITCKADGKWSDPPICTTI